MECQKEENLKSCPCSYPRERQRSVKMSFNSLPGCPRKGICCECIRHHREKGELPACYFSPEIEKTYDRSIESFIKNNK